jgi:hypothetical protein
MNYLKNKDRILEIRANTDSNAAAARIFAKEMGIEYTDTVRRRVSQIVNMTVPSQRKTTQKKWEEDNSKGTGYYEAVVNEEIKTLEDALAVANVDTDIWEVERWLCNTWQVSSKWREQDLEWDNGVMTGQAKRKNEWTKATNYQVKVWLKKRQITLDEAIKEVLPVIEGYTPKTIENVSGNGKTGVVTFTDFHIGADIKNLLKAPDFDITILIDYLHRATDIVNNLGYSHVYVNMLGDFFESLSGINHENTFKSLGQGMWGANVMIVANEIIATHLLSRIKNLRGVNIVSGNHDRMTPSKKIDNTGEGGKVLWYMLKKDFPDLPINYHNSVLAVEIDDINYLLTHGDKGYSRKEISKFVMDYGRTDMYNLVLEGHLHSRIVKKTFRSVRTQYEEIETVSLDDLNYRKIVCASLFTGNWFSESLGFNSAAGITVSENNGRGKPNVFDYSL